MKALVQYACKVAPHCGGGGPGLAIRRMSGLSVLALLASACCTGGSAAPSQPSYFSKNGLAWNYGYVHRVSAEIMHENPDAIEGLALKNVQYFSPCDSVVGFVRGFGFGDDAAALYSRCNADLASVEDCKHLMGDLKAGIAVGKWARYPDLWAKYDKDYGRFYALAQLQLDQGVLDAPENQWQDAVVAEIHLIHVTPALGSALSHGDTSEQARVAIPSDRDAELFFVLPADHSARILQHLERLYPR